MANRRLEHKIAVSHFTVAAHYAAVSEVYETAWCYQSNGHFQHWMLARVVETLPLECKTLVDIGCGTANFSRMLQDTASVQVVGVEPSAEMAEKARKYGVDVEVADAMAWAVEAVDAGVQIDAIMLKEVRHHINDPDRLYDKLAACLRPGGRILLLTRPDWSDGYPFPVKAHDSWAAGTQMPLQRHIEALEAAGLRVHVRDEKFPVRMAREEWGRLLRARFWSHLSCLNDNEINDGLTELNLAEKVEFDDCMTFVVAACPDKQSKTTSSRGTLSPWTRLRSEEP